MTQFITTPTFLFRLLRACAACMVVVAVLPSAIAATNSDACALLKPGDVTALLGGTPTASSNVTACRWTSTGSNKKLIVAKINMKTPGKIDMAYAGARQNAAQVGKVSDESGLGDKAFSVVGKSGFISLMIIKQGRMLQLQYMTEQSGSAKDLGALRTVAKKAVESF